MVQNSAVSCLFALDVDDLLIDSLVHELSKNFIVTYNFGLELLTVRHYKNEEVEKLIKDKDVLLTQKNSKQSKCYISEDDLSLSV